jgi:hypothetical protein
MKNFFAVVIVNVESNKLTAVPALLNTPFTLPVIPILTPFFNTTFTIPPVLDASYFAEGVLTISILI